MNDLIRRKDAIDYFVTNIGVVDADGYAVDDYDEVADAEQNEAKKSKPKRMKKAAVVEEAAPEPVEEPVEEVAEAAEEIAEVAEEAAEETAE